jgi:hypothetical protein
VDPRHTDSVADLQLPGCASFLNYPADNFMAENKRPLHDTGKLLPITAGHMQIGVAYAARLDLNKNLAVGVFRAWNFLDDKRRPKLMQDSGLHASPFDVQ